MKSLNCGYYAHVITDISIGYFFVNVYEDSLGDNLLMDLCGTFHNYSDAVAYIASL